MIPLGAIVRWKDVIYKSAWSGVVTGHPRAKMVEVDGRGAISEGLLEVVEMTLDEMQAMTTDQLIGSLRGEIAGLTEIVAQQCELIGELQEELAEPAGLRGSRDLGTGGSCGVPRWLTTRDGL